jgi:hypothetical protein
LEDTYVFLYTGFAFGICYFSWDGGHEEDETDTDLTTYSLGSYTKSALSYKYIGKIIRDRIKEIESSVYKIPKVPKN